MAEYTKIDTKLSNLQLNKLKKGVKNNEEVTLRIGAKHFNKKGLPHELLLTRRQITKLRNAINNNMSTDIKLSKAQIKKIIQSGGFLGSLLSKIAVPLMEVGLPLVRNVLAPLGLTATMSAIDAGIQKKIHGSGTTTLIISNENMNDIMKIIKSLEDSGVLLKVVTKTINNEIKKQKGGFLSMLLGTLGASLLGNLFIWKRNSKGRDRGGNKKKSLMPPHPLTNFEIREYYESEPRFNGVYSRDNLPKTIKNGAYIINLDEHANIGTHWIALYKQTNNEVVYFDSFGIEHIPEEIKKIIGNNKDIKTNIFRLHAYNSIMCGYFCIGFIDFMLASKNLVDFTSLFSSYDLKKNDKTIIKYFE